MRSVCGVMRERRLVKQINGERSVDPLKNLGLAVCRTMAPEGKANGRVQLLNSARVSLPADDDPSNTCPEGRDEDDKALATASALELIEGTACRTLLYASCRLFAAQPRVPCCEAISACSTNLIGLRPSDDKSHLTPSACGSRSFPRARQDQGTLRH